MPDDIEAPCDLPVSAEAFVFSAKGDTSVSMSVDVITTLPRSAWHSRFELGLHLGGD